MCIYNFSFVNKQEKKGERKTGGVGGGRRRGRGSVREGEGGRGRGRGRGREREREGGGGGGEQHRETLEGICHGIPCVNQLVVQLPN